MHPRDVVFYAVDDHKEVYPSHARSKRLRSRPLGTWRDVMVQTNRENTDV